MKIENIIKLTKTKIMLIYNINEYNYYVNIIEKYKDILLSYNWRRCFMYLEFSYGNELNCPDEFNENLINCIKDILGNFEKKCSINMYINNSKLAHIDIIQKIVNLDYFTNINFGLEFNLKKIDFRDLKNCEKIVYNGYFYENSFLLPENLKSITLLAGSNCKFEKKNIVFVVPKGLNKLFSCMYKSTKCIYNNESNIVINKLLIINTTIDNKTQSEFFHDYDFLIMRKFIRSNIKHIDFNNLPYTLKILHIHDKINQDILSLPNSIEELKINHYDKNLLENLPCTLKKIHLDFCIYMENINLFAYLPNSLEEIILDNVFIPNHVKIFDIKLPICLKILTILASSLNFDFILTKHFIENKINFKFSSANSLGVFKKYNFL
jgi:hypothetical protein